MISQKQDISLELVDCANMLIDGVSRRPQDLRSLTFFLLFVWGFFSSLFYFFLVLTFNINILQVVFIN